MIIIVDNNYNYNDDNNNCGLRPRQGTVRQLVSEVEGLQADKAYQGDMIRDLQA